MITLSPISNSEFQNCFNLMISGYADHSIASGSWTAEEALDQARKELENMLPEGIDTPNNSIFSLELTGQKLLIGYLWVAINEGSMFICDIEIYKKYRRKGYAQAAYRSLENYAKAKGITSIGAHIFNFNDKAQALSLKLGFNVTGVNVLKRLDDN